ncbi:MAG: PQQ-binding-like beta-propeller repeat protein [Bacteroidota bacterium]|nr:PQQ-binding-like beta-propeller repeat protein [Bacteroidota bacterium]
MKKLLRKEFLFFLCLGLWYPLLSVAQIPKEYVLWKFNASGPVHSLPIVSGNIIYFGDMNGNFYAVDGKNGIEAWSCKVRHPINSRAAIKGNVVCFEAGNALYGIDIKDGMLLWCFANGKNEPNISVDQTDYHHSSPVIYNDIAYFGDEYGCINGVNIKTGKGVFKYTTPDKKVIRSTPVIKDGIIYFGDWDGTVYAVSIPAKSLKWKYKMPNTRPKYGAVVSEMVIKDNLLYFGSQHDTFNPIDIMTGKPKWSFTDPDQTYLPTTPVFYKKDLIVGSTINANKIYCFNEGKVKWTVPTKGVFFVKPVFWQDSILIMNSSAFGNTGYLYFVNCKNGKVINEVPVEEAVPASPVIWENKLLLGRKDGLMAIDFKPYLTKK